MNNVLQNKFSEKEFAEYVSTYLPDFQRTDSRIETRRGFSAVKQIGESPLLDLVIFAVTPEASIHARMEISKQSYALLKTHPRAHALIAYHSDNTDEWRLSLITTQVTRDKKGVKETVSNPRRYSYVLGPKAKVNTPTKYLIAKGKVVDLNDIKERFSLAVVNKDFYREISNLFTKLTGGTHTSGKNKTEYKALLQLPSVPKGDQKNLEFAVRIIGRVIFCWFLREKRSVAGISLMPRELLSLEAIAKNPDYYHAILEPIFFEVLNKQLKSRKDRYISTPFSSIPYLNGGLFSPDQDDYFSYNIDKQTIYHDAVVVPDEWIRDFFAFLETYNFTIDENVSFDEELSIDPEMLGRIFENLLAEINPETGESARKNTGSYYTPRAIVDYMVDESLLFYLQHKTAIDEAKLRAVISYDLEDNLNHPLIADEFDKVISALGKIKILDPACGSGAFPIGALQKIVFILQQVDPDGRKWFENQVANTAPEIKRVIEREFANKNFNYIRKLGIIRENIFGIDIQAIATEISRLRCFLTLIVDESIHDELENRGIEPLPNLDFKFVTADALTQLPGANEETLFKDRERIEQLKELRNQFFNSTNSERQRLQMEFLTMQNEMLLNLKKVGTHDDITHALSTWHPFTHKASSWFDSEWMFGVEDGFDIIIANPPYVDSEAMVRIQPEMRSRYSTIWTTATGNWDLYIPFLELGYRYLNHTGVASYITPNKWYSIGYGKEIRSELNKRLVRIGDCNAVKVFEAGNSPVVTLYCSNKSSDHIVVDRFNDNFNVVASTEVSSSIAAEHFGVLFADDLSLISKIRSQPRKVSSYFDAENPCSVSEAYEIKKILEDAKGSSGSDSFRFVNTGTIDPYVSLWGSKDTTYLKSKYAYPVINKKKYQELFPRRTSQMSQPKLVISGMRHFESFLDTEGQYVAGKSTEILVSKNAADLKIALGIFNSKLIGYYISQCYNSLGIDGGINFTTSLIESLPFPDLKSPETSKLLTLVEQVIALTQKSETPAKIESDSEFESLTKKIDGIVYELYGLTSEDIGVIESKTT